MRVFEKARVRPALLASVLMAATCGVTVGQTRVDLQNQSKKVDFSAASTTKPAKTGAALPLTCSVGEAYVLTAAPVGQNWHICTAANTWSLQGTTANGSTLGLSVAKTDATHLTIGQECTGTTPCHVSIGEVVYSFSGPSTVLVQGASTGTAYIYVDNAGGLIVGHTMTLSCSGFCTEESDVTSFPAGVIPIATWTASNGTWTSGIDFRSSLGREAITVATGLTSVIVSGKQILSVDLAAVATRVAVPDTATSSCTAGTWAADDSFYYICTATDTWKRAAVASW